VESTVDHEAAVKTLAAERYILGEMDDKEAEQFEEHFFDCRLCAQDVRDTATFGDGVKAAFGRQPVEDEDRAAGTTVRVIPKPWYRNPQLVMPYAAVLLLGIVIVFQAAGPGGSITVEPLAMEPVMLVGLRAAVQEVTVPDGQDRFFMVVDIISPETYPQYSLRVLTEEGIEVAVMQAAAPAAGSLGMDLPSDRFPAGTYSVVLSGIDAVGDGETTLETFRFKILEN
jgi:hypothetical protein